MKRYSNNSELAHIWAQRTQTEGKASNMFFEGDKIYSYGHHFLIAQHLDNNHVLFNSAKYSNSTAKHKLHVMRAISHKTVFTVPILPIYKPMRVKHHKANIIYYDSKIKNLKQKLLKCKTCMTFYEESIGRIITERNEYVFHFNLSSKILEINDIISPQDQIVIRDKIRRKYDLIQQKDNRDREKVEAFKNNQLKEWLNNEVEELFNIPKYFNKVYLRIKGDDIESSKGASCTIGQGFCLYTAMKLNKTVHGFKLTDNYTVCSYIDGVLKIGCHEIEKDQIDKIVKELNW